MHSPTMYMAAPSTIHVSSLCVQEWKNWKNATDYKEKREDRGSHYERGAMWCAISCMAIAWDKWILVSSVGSIILAECNKRTLLVTYGQLR